MESNTTGRIRGNRIWGDKSFQKIAGRFIFVAGIIFLVLGIVGSGYGILFPNKIKPRVDLPEDVASLPPVVPHMTLSLIWVFAGLYFLWFWWNSRIGLFKQSLNEKV